MWQVVMLLPPGGVRKGTRKRRLRSRLRRNLPWSRPQLGTGLVALQRKDEAERAFANAMQMAKAPQSEDQSELLAPLIAALRHPLI
jgi:hypothetical protein